MRKIHDLYQLMPGKGCGICGSISCRQFARRLATGEETPEECSYMNVEAAEKVRALLKEGIEICRKPPPQDELLVIQPCTSNPKKVMTGGRIGRETRYGILDSIEMCRLARKSALLKNQKVSEKLGIATFRHENTEVSLYDNGKISIKEADTREDALKAIAAADRIFRAAYICPTCGGSAIDCAKGFCKCDQKCELVLGRDVLAIETEKMSAEELEKTGMEMLAGKNVRAGLLLLALAECTETLTKTGSGEVERARNNQECLEKIRKELEPP